MFIQINSDSNFDSNSGYDSDNSNYSEYSNHYGSSTSSTSSNSSNSSNFTITSDPVNYYTKDNLKQNHQQFNMQTQTQTQIQMQMQMQTQIPIPIPLYSLRKKQNQYNLEMHRHKLSYIRDELTNNENNNNNNQIITVNIGYNSGFDKNTPFINALINKRINFCELGASSHIAAFIPVSYTSRCYLIRDWKGKGKDHYG